MKLIIAASEKPGGAIERQAKQKLKFPEINEAALGFSNVSTSGKGVSTAHANQLFNTASEIIDVGINDPSIFELVMLFEEGFGPDLISDMTICVIGEHLSRFNLRVCKKLGIPTSKIRVKGFGSIAVAHSASDKRNFLLIPKAILSDLPEANCRDDIDRIIAYNDSVREEVNRMFGDNWSKVARKMNKSKLKKLLLKHPDFFKELIASYKHSDPQPYDYENDPLGEYVWDEWASEYSQQYPLKLSQPQSVGELKQQVSNICVRFKELVENNGLCDVLFKDNGRQRPETTAQLLFYAIADSYCAANSLDLSREPNAGNGPVDFKLSAGKHRALVEIKLSSNRKGVEGLLLQLPSYAKSESSVYDILLMVVISENRAVVEDVQEAHDKQKKAGKNTPDLIIVEAFEAYHAPSASKLKF